MACAQLWTNKNVTSNNFSVAEMRLVLESVWKNDTALTIIYIAAYGLVTLLALLGNLLVVVAVYNTPSMQSSVNILIVNMSVGGILYALFVLPTSLVQVVYYDWFLGAFMCKVTAYIQGVVVTSVIYTLIAIAVDRYIAICGKLQANTMSKHTTVSIMVVTWLLAAALMVPYALYFEAYSFDNVVPQVTSCQPNRDAWPNFDVYFMTVVFLANYTIPLCLITFCYSSIAIKVWKKEKAFGTSRHIGGSIRTGRCTESTWRVVKMMAMIVFLFAFSWLPLYTIRMISIATASYQQSESNQEVTNETDGDEIPGSQTKLLFCNASITNETEDHANLYREVNVINDVLIPLTQWLSSSNCCVNPWVYCFFSPKYRRAFKRISRYILCGRFCVFPLPEDEETTLRRTQSYDYRKFSQVRPLPRERSASQNQCSRHSSMDVPFDAYYCVHKNSVDLIAQKKRSSDFRDCRDFREPPRRRFASVDKPIVNDSEAANENERTTYLQLHSSKNDLRSAVSLSKNDRLTVPART